MIDLVGGCRLVRLTTVVSIWPIVERRITTSLLAVWSSSCEAERSGDSLLEDTDAGTIFNERRPGEGKLRQRL